MSEQDAKAYKHSALRERSSSRLLTLLPGTPGSTLRCQIDEFTESSNTSYEALSYAWGDPELSQYIEVCESADVEPAKRFLKITSNLHQALQRLRTQESRRLWVDALCINQDDLQEKGHQVARMGQTYRNADQVIVWLGEDDAYPRTRALLMQDGKNRWPLTVPEADLGELVTIPWFFRVWAVQEYVLPKHVSYQLGSLSIPAQHVEVVIARTGAYLDGEKNLYDQWKSIILLFQYRMLAQERKSNTANPRMNLVRTFLDLTRQRLCKDSRDRIYGILGIFDNTSMIPDYSLPQQQVYQEFVSKHLEAGDFAILHECCIGVANADEQSYVPFFGQSRSRTKYIPFVDPSGATYSAGLHRPPRVTLAPSGSISVQGSSIDVVQRKLDFSEDCQIELDSTGLVVHNTSETAQIPLQGTWGAIYQTIMGHYITDPIEKVRWRKDYEEKRLSPEFMKVPYSNSSLFDVIIRAIRTDLNADYDFVSSKGQIRTDAHLHRARRNLLAERSLFWTDQGFIGLGSRYLQPGDELAIFDGDTTPFLLRQSDSSGDTGKAYKIVSDCYVTGWMYGPFPDRTVAKDLSRRESLVRKLKGTGIQQITPVAVAQTFVIN
ncbi:heterokaryon incompatibility protein-domain-containing protein [Paraphoma chrysanthemicola]|uniref:Heterokaryon incompatibility protein-domain-containing protein n=1 Tax=Paraphoma chrysanthemicola TaxID=798071 RepID=A0A8K0RAH1_9PLEO|nr:heterokaryon incompatibility protein-domain-containing protein [Paraphoma chrysanthemicola]